MQYVPHTSEQTKPLHWEHGGGSREYECPCCGTIYFELQECDWCPGVVALSAIGEREHD